MGDQIKCGDEEVLRGPEGKKPTKEKRREGEGEAQISEDEEVMLRYSQKCNIIIGRWDVLRNIIVGRWD